MKSYIVIKTQFDAIHHWPGCDIEEVSYLRHPHRHVFHVVMKWAVEHGDRQIEFIQQKNRVDSHIASTWKGRHIGSLSCEMMAEKLLRLFAADYVSVFEDNENGAEVLANG